MNRAGAKRRSSAGKSIRVSGTLFPSRGTLLPINSFVDACPCDTRKFLSKSQPAYIRTLSNALLPLNPSLHAWRNIHVPPAMSSTYNLPYRGLPPELRLRIWRYCFTKTLWYRRHNDHGRGPILSNSPPGIAILRLDKRTHAEAKEAMIQSIWLKFLDTSFEEIIRLLRRISPGLSYCCNAEEGNRTAVETQRRTFAWALPNGQRLSLIQGISISPNVSPIEIELVWFLIRGSPIEHLVIRRRASMQHHKLNMTCRSFILLAVTEMPMELYRIGALKSLGFEICGFTKQELDRDKSVLGPFEEWASDADLSMTYEPSWDPDGENLLLTFVRK